MARAALASTARAHPRPGTPAEDGAAAYHAFAAEWRAYWRGEGRRPVARCCWPVDPGFLDWLAAYDGAVARGRDAWLDGLSGEERLTAILDGPR